MNALTRANLVLLALLLGHTLDHAVNQPGRHYSAALIIPGPLGIGLAVLAAVMAARNRREAAPLSMLLGVGTIAGFVAIHLLPHWSTFSDPYSKVDTNFVNWVLVALPMLAGAWVFWLGLRELRHTAVASPHPAR